MAYNLQPLITILERILNPEQKHWILDHNQPQLQSLLQKSISLRKILDKASIPKIGSLERLIKDAAHEAEDLIESEMVAKMLCSPEDESLEFITPDLQQVMQELDSAMDQVVKLVGVEGNKMRSGGSSSGTGASDPTSSKSSVVVGVKKDLEELKDRLTGMHRELEIIPIVGMGGIGKTTLAQKLYQDSSIISHFQYARAWATISQDYNMSTILPDLLRCIIGKEFDEEHIGKESDELKDILYQSLYGRRYLIVLDDIWNIKFWDEIRMYFPDNNNGSRIVITSRESGVAKHVGSQSVQHQVQLLGESASWNLLRQIVFGEAEEDCPDELQGMGEKIASDCGGLPLAINVIGGVLSKVERSVEAWEMIGNDVRGAITESDEQFSNILTLSYDHLPNHLKPCFLYMAAFPEDYQITASRLVRLWVIEGFVKSSNNNKSLEEEAEDYLKALVGRNLVSVKENNYYYKGKKAKRYNVHDMLRDLCIRKGEDDEFIHVMMNEPKDTYSSVRRLIVHNTSFTTYVGGSLYSYAELMSLGRSFIYFGHHHLSYSFLLPHFLSELGLIRVLDFKKRKFTKFPREILQLVNLQYLAFWCYSGFPREISRLRNLQTLIAKMTQPCSVPCDIIWEMSELRHLKFKRTINVTEGEYTIEFVHKKLQTLFCNIWISDLLISNGFFDSIPNIRDLEIMIDGLMLGGVVDLSRLHKLQTLRCSYLYSKKVLIFPSNLRNLHLNDCTVNAELLKALCALPNLELLEIRYCAFDCIEDSKEEEWETKEGDEYQSLQVLLLNECHQLVRWRADETNFPRLRHLVLEYCRELEEIPSGIGEIPTLQYIEVCKCSDSVVESARRIVEEQQSEYGNYHLQLHETYYS